MLDGQSHFNIYIYILASLQVLEVDGDDIKVQFLRQQGHVYVFPNTMDISWCKRGDLDIIADYKVLRRGQFDFGKVF